MKLNKDFREFVELLNSKKVEYLLVGGYAVGFYGYPRYTGDIDIWIKISEQTAQKMSELLNEFGFGSLNLTEKDFLEPKIVIQLGYPPYRIDILTSVTALDFDYCYERRNLTMIDNIQIQIIDKESLLLNKKALDRDKDRNDLANLPIMKDT
jgi:hypothetical protein